MQHTPVLLAETLNLLDPQPGDTVIDATVGSGGHARALLEAIGPRGKLLALDRDPDALSTAKTELCQHSAQVRFVHASFESLEAIARREGFTNVQRILFDLGLSSPQLADPQRGFSFQTDGPLDMRFDPCHDQTTAADLVNRSSFTTLRSILAEYGEESQAADVARALVRARTKQTISTTHQLLTVLEGVRTDRRRHHPATQIFQALRIAVNRELEVLTAALPQALRLLAPGGRLAVITFHSLEDRSVKQFFRGEARGCLCAPESPICVCEHQATIGLVTRKAVVPAGDEVRRNPRARSAKLRVVIKRTHP